MSVRSFFGYQNAAPAAWVFALGSWLSQQFLGAESWFSKLPFGWLSLICLAFWIGQDAYHPQGRFRIFYRTIRSFGIFGPVATKPEFFSLGENYGGSQKFVGVLVPFTFSEKKTLVAVRVKSKYYRYLASKIGAYIGSYEWKFDEGKLFLPQEQLQIPIAFIPEKAGNPGVYGDQNIKGYCFSHGTAHFITIQVISKNWTQEKSIQILMPSGRPSFEPPSDADSGGIFLWFEDMQIPHAKLEME